ncbi:MAG: FKBP-type peptidyl-prolyl cis-trans isomerase [Polyangiaceae bacterium]
MKETKDNGSQPKTAGFRVGPGMFVELTYEVRDADGEAVGAGDERLGCVFGMGQLLPKVEQTVDGLAEGDVRTVKLPARDAYGPRDPEALLEVERGEFPGDVTVGDYFEVENADEGVLVLRVLEVTDEAVLVDLNHPLAGQDLDVTVRIISVRPATQEESDQAMRAGIEGEDPSSDGLIAPESLLRGPKRR